MVLFYSLSLLTLFNKKQGVSDWQESRSEHRFTQLMYALRANHYNLQPVRSTWECSTEVQS